MRRLLHRSNLVLAILLVGGLLAANLTPGEPSPVQAQSVSTPHSLALDGTGSAEVPSEADLNLTSSWTVELWFKDTDPAGFNHPYRYLINKGDGVGPESPFFVLVGQGNVLVGLRSGGVDYPLSYNLAAAGMRPGEWIHVAATFDAPTTTLALKLDGAFIASKVINVHSTGNSLRLEIGRQGPTTGKNWVGLIDDVRLWDLVRSASEVQANYLTELPTSPTPTGLVANWRFDGDETDSVGGQTATLNGGAVLVSDVPQTPPQTSATATPTPTPSATPTATTTSTVTATATATATATTTATATATPVNPLTGASITLVPQHSGPDVAGNSQSLVATLTDSHGTPMSGIALTFTVTGPNPMTGTGLTDTNGQSTFNYQGHNSGTDTVVASATNAGLTIQSNQATVDWITPVQQISTSTAWARFFFGGASGNFDANPSMTPAFTMALPTINFNPPSGTVPGNTSGVNEFTRPFTDVTTDLNGNFTGTIVAQGNGLQAGTGSLFTFDGVFTGQYVVAAPGDVSFNFYSDDGFIFGVGGGATRVSGASRNPPAGNVTPFENFPVMGDFNGPTSPVANTITVHFPAAGSYPYEVDYAECCGGQLAITMTTATSTGNHGVPPTGSLTLTQAAPPANGHASFNVAAFNASGAALANLPISLEVTGPNAQEVKGTTDSTGHVTLTYSAANPGTDTVQASAWISNLAIYSGQLGVVWSSSTVNTSNSGSTSSPLAIPGWIGGPAPGAKVTGQVPITVGSGLSLSNATVDFWSADDLSAVTTLVTGASGGSGATLATLDTTTLANGSYLVRVRATGPGGVTQSSGTLVTVTGENKPGRVKFDVTDLTVPLTGMPITIGRTYDSLDRNTSGDFGFGWHLTVGSAQVETDPLKNVTLTLPNGQRATFAFTPRSVGGVFGFLLTPAYTPDAGVYGSLSSEGCGLLVVSGGQYFCFPGLDYQPTTYVYTDPAGRIYTLNADGSFRSIKDITGNTILFNASGATGSISSSSGQPSVGIDRDSSGRITSITDPSGNVFHYAYDGAGNLTRVALPGVSTPASYSYNANHLLTDAADPRGNHASATYTADGRLATDTDPAGNTTHFAYDLVHNTRTITAPDGGVIVDQNDAFGKVTSETDALGHVTTSVYDASHNLTSQTDPLGHTTTYAHDSQGNLTTLTNALGKSMHATFNANSGLTSFTDDQGRTRSIAYDTNSFPTTMSDSIGQSGAFSWDAHGNLASLTDANGGVTSFAYDSAGNQVSQTDPLSHSTTRTFDTNGHVTSIRDANGATTNAIYDALGHLTTLSASTGTQSFTYDSAGNVISSVDGLNRSTTYEYDALNRLIKTTYPDGTTTSITYDFRGNPLQQVDQSGNITHYVYDLAGQLRSVTVSVGTPDEATTSYTYDAAGHILTKTDPLGHTTTYAYDAAGRLTSQTDPLNHATTFTWSDAWQLIAQTDPNNQTTHFAYDARGHLTTTTFPDGTTEVLAYDGLGHVTTRKDQNGNTTTYTYDGAGRLISVADPLGQTTNYAYDAVGNMSGVTDPNNHQTTFAYDAAQRVTQKNLPDGTFESYVYDSAGNLTRQELTDGNSNLFGYDALDRLTSATYFDGQHITYGYTPTGQRQAVTDARGTTTYGYNHRDQLTSIANPAGQQLTYVYDTAGQRTGMNTPAGLTNFAYDAAGRMTSAGGAAFGYDANGNRTSMTLPNGVAATFAYDALNRLTNESYHQGASVLAQYQYVLDAAGNRIGLTEADGNHTVWTYDKASRLTGETRTPAGGSAVTTTYGYDSAGNRVSLASGGATTSYAYNALDELTSAGATSYAYDGRGNLTSASGPGGATTYRWDGTDRLVGATLPDGTSIANVYDADGRRVRQTVGTSVTNSLWDEASQYGDVVYETDGSGAPQANYLVAQGERLSQTRGGATSYYVHDSQDSVRALTDGAGAVSDTYTYDGFGQTLSHTGTSPNSFGFAGLQSDASHLDNMRARYYDPAVGRFLSRDQAAINPLLPSQVNRYVYAADNPTTLTDPSGNEIAMEYPMIVEFISLRQAAAIAAIGAAVACIFYRVASVLMALNHDGAGLVALSHVIPPMCIIPIQKTDPGSMPTIAAHIQAAQNAGYPMLLVYNGPLNPLTQANRNAACPPAVRAMMRPLSCDEYPYASTLMGGAGASVAPVPIGEQYVQGGTLRGFYGRFQPYYGRPMLWGDYYAAVVDPDP